MEPGPDAHRCRIISSVHHEDLHPGSSSRNLHVTSHGAVVTGVCLSLSGNPLKIFPAAYKTGSRIPILLRTMSSLGLQATRHRDPFLPCAIDVVCELQRATHEDFGAVLSPLRSMVESNTSAPFIGQPPFPLRELLHIKIDSIVWLLAELIQKQSEVSRDYLNRSHGLISVL